MRVALRRRLYALWSAVLTTGAVVGAICLLLTLVAPLVGLRPLIFLSGSMSPTIPAGSLALARTVDASMIEVNDIVTVPSNGTYLTHRVVDVTHAPGRATLLLRGDGNKEVDAALHEVTSAPRTEIWVPHVGSFVTWFSRAPGVYVLAAWVAIVLSSLRRPRRSDSRPQGPPVGRPKLWLVAERAVGSTPRSVPRLPAAPALGTFQAVRSS